MRGRVERWTALGGAGLVLVALLACKKKDDAPAPAASAPAEPVAETPPPAPAFPGWVIKTDVAVSQEKIGDVESRLGGKIKALRNVVYEVNGRTVQVNVIVPRDATEADKLYGALTKMKPAWAVVRKGNVVYEFVGRNESMDDMKKAHDTLAAL
jgi:hypothetical protein